MTSEIAYDGQSYYCTLCGKAGFESQFHAYGHVPRCKAKGVTPSPSNPVIPYPLTPSHRSPDPVTPYPLTLGYSGLSDRVNQLEKSVNNEMAHLRGVKQNDWRSILVWLGIAFMIGFVVSKVLSDDGRGKQIGDKVVNKVIDKGITKVLGKVL